MANILSIISRNTSPGLKRTTDTKPDIYIMRVDADPSAGDGTEAPTGSIAIYDAPGGTTVYYKYDNLDTSWRSFLDADGLVGITPGETDTNISDFNKIITVDPAGFGDYTTITAAIAAISANELILVAPGEYTTANGETFPLTLPDDVTIKSIGGREVTVIDASGTSSINMLFGNNCVIDGFWFKHNTTKFNLQGNTGVGAGTKILRCKTTGVCYGFANIPYGTTIEDLAYALDWTTQFIRATSNGSTNGNPVVIRNMSPIDSDATPLGANAACIVPQTLACGLIIEDSFIQNNGGSTPAITGAYSGSAFMTIRNCYIKSTGGYGILPSNKTVPYNIYNSTFDTANYSVDFDGTNGSVNLHNCRFIGSGGNVWVENGATGSEIYLFNTPIKTLTITGTGTLTRFQWDGMDNTFVITPGTDDDYPNRTEALAMANTLVGSGSGITSSTILANPGTYTEAENQTVSSGISFIGRSTPNDTIFEVSSFTANSTPMFTINNGFVAKNIQFRNTDGTSKGIGIFSSAANLEQPTIENCWFTDLYFGIHFDNSVINGLIKDPQFFGNSANFIRQTTGGGELRVIRPVVSALASNPGVTSGSCFYFDAANRYTEVVDADIESAISSNSPCVYHSGDTSTTRVVRGRYVNTTTTTSRQAFQTQTTHASSKLYVDAPITSGFEDQFRFGAAGNMRITNLDGSYTITGTPGDLEIDAGLTRADAGSTVTVLVTDQVVLSSYSATGIVAVNLPDITQHGPPTLTIKDSGGNAGGNNITINRAGADTIDGATSATINTNYGSITFVKNGTEWSII